MKKDVIVFIPLLMLSTCGVFAQNFSKTTEIRNPNASVYDQFGTSVAIDQNLAVIGNPGDDDVNTNNNQHFSNNPIMEQNAIGSGSAYIYEKDANNSWIKVQQIFASDKRDSSDFGFSCAVSGGTIAIGAPTAQPAGYNYRYSGAVYIYNLVGNTWQQTQKIVGPTPASDMYFGYSVAIHGDNMVIGAPGDGRDENGNLSNARAGSVYLYRLVGGTWIFKQKLVGTSKKAYDNYGKTIKISAEDIMVRYTNHNYDIYSIDANGNATLKPDNQLIFNEWQDGRYAAVAIKNDIAVFGFTDVSYMSGATNCFFCGEVLVYQKDANGVWKKIQTIHQQNSTFKYGFGVAFDGNSLAIRSENGSNVEIFKLSGGSFVYSKIVSMGANSSFNSGESMAMSDNNLIVDDSQFGGPSSSTPYGSGRIFIFSSTDITTSTDENTVTNTNIYPNPSSGSFTINRNDIKYVKAYNELGQCEILEQGSQYTTNMKGLVIIEIVTKDDKILKSKIIIE